MPYSPTNAAWSGVNKATTKATKVARETLSWITPIGKPMKAAKAGKAVSKALKASKKTKPLATPKSNVKVLPRKTAPKSDLSSRGARLTPTEKASRASDLDFAKAEKNYDASNEMRYTGLRSYPKGYEKSTARGPGKRNARKAAAIKKEAKPVVKINSQRNLKKK